MALRSIAASVLPESTEWEILIVDNNSRDDTSEVARQFVRQHPAHFRYLFEAQPGKSHALNSGIREARGDVIAFMDDDVTVEPDWLRNLVAPFAQREWAGAGGRILPSWECSPPRWLPREGRYALAPFALFDLGQDPHELDEPPFGTNMAFRKEMFFKYGGFRTDIGPQPGSQIRNEDTEFGKRIMNAGERLWYVPTAVVHHPVTAERVQKKYLLDWWFDKARADIREFGVPVEYKWSVAGVPFYLFRRIIVASVKWITALNPSRRFEQKTKVWGKLGEIKECYSRSAKNSASLARPPAI